MSDSKLSAMVALAGSPLTEADLLRLNRLVELSAGNPAAVVGMYSQLKGVGIACVASGGAATGWVMFTAPDEATAAAMAGQIHAQIGLALTAMTDAADQVAAQAIDRARAAS
jgi:hypothetical protein